MAEPFKHPHTKERLIIPAGELISKFTEVRSELQQFCLGVTDIGRVAARPRTDAAEVFIAEMYRTNSTDPSQPIDRRQVTHQDPFIADRVMIDRRNVNGMSIVLYAFTEPSADRIHWQLELGGADWQLLEIEIVPVAEL